MDRECAVADDSLPIARRIPGAHAENLADVERAMSEPSQSERMVALEEALHETTRMADLVESLLTLARADEGRFDIHREPVELKPLVDDVYETALILGEGAGVAVNLQFTAEVTIMGDKGTPFAVLKRVMATATAADFGKVSLAVIQREVATGGGA